MGNQKFYAADDDTDNNTDAGMIPMCLPCLFWWWKIIEPQTVISNLVFWQV